MAGANYRSYPKSKVCRRNDRNAASYEMLPEQIARTFKNRFRYWARPPVEKPCRFAQVELSALSKQGSHKPRFLLKQAGKANDASLASDG